MVTMFSLLRTTLTRLPSILQRWPVTNINTSASLFHLLAKQTTINSATNQCFESKLLIPISPLIVPNCGFKVKGRLKRRCKDCYFVVRQKRLFVICETHPRHKQMSMIPKEKNTWILTHATMGKVRQW